MVKSGFLMRFYPKSRETSEQRFLQPSLQPPRMHSRVFFGVSLTAILLISLIQVPVDVELSEEEMLLRADSEPEFLLQAGGSSGHENGSFIDSTPTGWIVSGNTRNNMNFGATQLQATSIYNNNNDADSYVAAINDQGDWEWALMPDASQGLTLVRAMGTSMTGDAYIGGLIFGTVTFGNTPNSPTLTAQNGYGDGFVAKVDAMGQWVWATQFSTPSNNVSNNSIVTGLYESITGSVIVSGTHKGETDFGGITKTSADSEFFLVDLDMGSGALNWVSTAGGIGNDNSGGVVTDSIGNIWQVGRTSGTFSANGKSHQAISTADTVIVKWSAQGVVQNIIGLVGAAGDINQPEDVIITSTDDIIVSGVFTGSLNAGGQNTLSDKGNGDAYVAKILKTGSTDWVVSAGSSSALERAYSVAESSTGSIVVGGMISTLTDFGIHTIDTTGSLDLYMAQLDSSGSWEWVENLGSVNLDLFADLAINMSDIPAAFGSFQGTINKGTSSVTSSGGLDLVVWSLDPVNNEDKDNDGVNDLTDNCPNTNNPLQIDSDLDGDGDECDYDDDNDGITDNSGDDCPRGGAWNWTSDSTTDFDNDGCKDSSEDNDDDNDGIEDDTDSCLSTYSPPRNWWTSDSSNDIDQDGCRDADEDMDDDGDGFDDAADDCSKEAGSSTLGTYQGCVDSDDDGWADLEDTCPNEFGNSSMAGTLACPDSDGDGWANFEDDLPNDSTQWVDTDGDGYGDNPNGKTPDSCLDISGTSVLDRYGCPDPDNDGYSSTDDSWSVSDGADAFPTDETQWSDWDEDGFGDNYGNISWVDRSQNWPGEYYQYARDQDACPTLPGNSWRNDILGCPDGDGDGWADFMDAFPADANEYRDSDGDGIADGYDDCVDVAGNSTEDVLGCPDYDGDGWGDPEIGSDWRPLDPTQWSDSDGDGYGDNPQGTNPDSCLTEAGQSFRGAILGCIDSDGDGWADSLDKFPDDSTQWNDTDGDGFGDNPDGLNADECPEIAGVEEENGCEKVITESSSSVLKYGGIAVGVILISIISLLLTSKIRNSKSGDDWIKKSALPPMPNMNARLTNADSLMAKSSASIYESQLSTPVQYPDLANLAGNQQVVSQPTVLQQWTDANGNTWRSMSDGSTLWWNGSDWQRAG